MNGWQEWAVGLLLLLCIGRIGWGVYRFFVRVKKKDNPCENCATGCELRTLYESKRRSCRKELKKTKKKCCG